jgi:hypothetical protein
MELYHALQDQRGIISLELLEEYSNLLEKVVEGSSCKGLESQAVKLVRR